MFETEPLPADSPLWDMPNVLVTPHNAAISAGNEARVRAIFLENLRRWRRGEPLLNEAAPVTSDSSPAKPLSLRVPV